MDASFVRVAVDGRTYRHYAPSSRGTVPAVPAHGGGDAAVPSYHETDMYGDDGDDTAVEFDEGTGMYSVRLTVPHVFYGRLIGKRGATLARLQKDTGATVSLPRRGAKSEIVVISGTARGAVVSCKNRVEMIVLDAHRTQEYTHFLSLPLCVGSDGEALRRGVESWRGAVLREHNGAEGLDASVLIAPERVHLTLLMLKLVGEKAEQRACSVLKQCHAAVYDALDTRTCMVPLRGVQEMGDDPSAAHVLYAEVADGEDRARLARVRRVLFDAFMAAGLIAAGDREDQREWKMHATILNTRHRKGAGKGRVPVDVRTILPRYAAHEWGTHRVGAVHLSTRGRMDRATNYYAPLAKIVLP